MTPDDVAIGAVLWSKARRGSDDTAARYGMVVSGRQVTGEGEPFFLIADAESSAWWVGKQGQKSMTRQKTVTLRRLFYGDIDWDAEPPLPEAAKMAGYARKCWLSAAVRTGYLSDVDRDLMAAAWRLWDAVDAMQNPTKEKTE